MFNIGDRVRVVVNPGTAEGLPNVDGDLTGVEGTVVGTDGADTDDNYQVVLDGYDEPFNPIAAILLQAMGLPANARPVQGSELEAVELTEAA